MYKHDVGLGFFHLKANSGVIAKRALVLTLFHNQ